MCNFKKLFTYMVVGALVMALSISCKNNDKTGSEGGVDLGSIPTASGTEATTSELSQYNAKTYQGTVGSSVTRKSFNSNPQEFGEQFSLEANGEPVFVTINDGKINYSGASQGAQIQIYKSADGKYIASEDTNLDGFRYKSYIQITFNSASEITFYLYTGMSGGPVMTESGTVYKSASYIAEYEGTLTAQAGSN